MKETTLHGVPETMLQTLCARAMETETGRGYVSDPKAVEIVRSLDYDFTRARSDTAMRTGVIARTILLDRMTDAYLSSHQNTVVINLACGLDTRVCRMKGRFRLWYQIDLPETMAVRRRFFTPDETVRQISASAMNPVWAENIPADSPVLVLIEGLSMYLTEQDVTAVFGIIDAHFPHADVFLETMHPFVVSHVKEKSIEGSSARFTWGVRNGKALEPLIPPFRSVADRSLSEGMEVLFPAYRILGKLPFIRHISNQILVFSK